MKIMKRYQKHYHVKTATPRTFTFSRKQNVYLIWINLTRTNQGMKAFCNASSVWGSLVKSYPLGALVNQNLTTIYNNNSHG